MSQIELRKTEWQTAAMQLILLIVAAAVLIIFVPVGRAVIGGSVALKLVFLSRMILLLVLATWLLRRDNRSWADLGLRRPDIWRCLALIPVGLIVIGTSVTAVRALLARAGIPSADYSAFGPLRGNLAEYLFWLVPVTVGSAAFGEEMIFRGFLRDAFERLFGGKPPATAVAILAQAIVFGFFHAYQGVGGIVTTLVVGFLLGIVWWAAGRNLWPGIIIHAVLDGSAVTAVFLGLASS